MNVCEKDVSRSVRLRAFSPNNHLETPRSPLSRNQRKLIKDSIASEILFQALIDDYVGCDNQKICREIRSWLVPFVEIAPNHRHGHNPRFAGTCCHFERIASEVFWR